MISILILSLFLSLLPEFITCRPHTGRVNSIIPPTATLVTPPLTEFDIFTKQSFNAPEGIRHFYTYSPSSYNNTSSRPLPLAFFFHGFTDVCEQFMSQFSVFALMAEKYRYHFIVGCGTYSSQGAGPGWNSGVISVNQTIDDVAYARRAVAIVKAQVKVDERRVFAFGHSNGAAMSEALACNASDVFTAIASNAGGTNLVPGGEAGLKVCDEMFGKNSTSILLIHGTGDQAVPYNGSISAGLPSVKRDFSAWASRVGCSGDPVNNWRRGIASSLHYQNCRDRAEVELVTIDGGIHMFYVLSDFQSASYVLEFFDRVTKRNNKN